MKIVNDVLTFDPSDILLFSTGMQAALAAYVGKNTTADVFLSGIVNQQLQIALKIAAQAGIDNLTALALAYQTATPAAQAAATGFINQAQAALGLAATPAGVAAPAVQSVAKVAAPTSLK